MPRTLRFIGKCLKTRYRCERRALNLGISNGPLCINVDASQRSCNYAMTVDVAPEPASLALFGLAGLALLCVRRVRRVRRG